jgi:hypothetical protein
MNLPQPDSGPDSNIGGLMLELGQVTLRILFAFQKQLI